MHVSFIFFHFFSIFLHTFEIIQQKAGAKKTQKKSTGDPKQGEEAHGILEGISSLHSWIKTQTMIRPHPKGGKGGKHGAIYDEVNILG